MLEEFQQKLGYTFKNPQLLQNALTHSSYANEHKREGMGSNERLEFLGDAILGLVVAEYLYRTHPDKPEGELTKLRAEMVCEKSLYEVATRLELGSEDVLLTVRAQYIRRILDNVGSNLIKYADPARPIEVRFLRQEGRAGLVFRNHVLPTPPAVESTKVGLTSIETMMDKMHADCKIEQENEQFTMRLLFPVE